MYAQGKTASCKRKMDDALSSTAPASSQLQLKAPPFTILRERVATEVLSSVAGRKASWQPKGGSASLRTILCDVLACCSEGVLVSAWTEESQMHRGRRYSGRPPLPSRTPAGSVLAQFKGLACAGVNPSTIGKSLFAFPRYIRNLARAGLQDCYIMDLANAHPAITLRRHPSLQALPTYVNQREQVLTQIPCHRFRPKEPSTRLLYGREAHAWLL